MWLLALLMWAPLWIFTKLSFLRTPIPVNDLGHLITAHIYLPTWTVGMRSSRLPYVVSNLVCSVVKWTEWSTQSPVTDSFPQKPPRVHRPRYHFYLCPGGARPEPAWNCPGFLEKGPLLSEAWECLGSRKNVPDCSLYSALWVFSKRKTNQNVKRTSERGVAGEKGLVDDSESELFCEISSLGEIKRWLSTTLGNHFSIKKSMLGICLKIHTGQGLLPRPFLTSFVLSLFPLLYYNVALMRLPFEQRFNWCSILYQKVFARQVHAPQDREA